MNKLENLYIQKYHIKPDKIEVLRSDGSDRKIYRIFQGDNSYIGIIGNNKEENEAFLEFSKHFKKFGLRVPEIYAEDLSQEVYIEQDFGDDTLFQWMGRIRQKHGFNDEIKNMYRRVVEILPHFQITAGTSINYSYCYQHIEFARESMSWDLHYFKHRFLNYFYNKKIDHTSLEKDFNTLIEFLLEEDRKYFLYRDFQSRNVMIKDNIPHFIDYQSGRKGALQYDLASLLYDAKANLPQEFREELTDVYLRKVEQIIDLNEDRFRKYFYGFVLVRIMQAFGAYGYLSAVKGKIHFFKSVPYAIKNLQLLLNKDLEIINQLPTLRQIFFNLIEDKSLTEFSEEKELVVRIHSFSFHNSGIPRDTSGNNGGFVFDCRFLPNPGREEKYKTLTGKDSQVIEYFSQYKIVSDFLDNVYKIVNDAVDNYHARSFTDLMISFGCTGGKHRSVYCAEKLTEHLKKKHIAVQIQHVELKKMK